MLVVGGELLMAKNLFQIMIKSLFFGMLYSLGWNSRRDDVQRRDAGFS